MARSAYRPGLGIRHPELGSLALRWCVAALACIALASCQTGGGGGGGGLSLGGGASPQSLAQDFGNPTGEKTKIALLLPLSSKDTRVRAVAQSLKEAAELALFDFNNPNIILVPKDTKGTAAGARFAADEAIKDGAELILGPLRAQAVSAAGQVAQASNTPVVAFSTTESVAGNGIYLLGFLPSIEVERIVDFTIQQGKKRFAALVPARAYGNVIAGDLTRIVQEQGGTLFSVERFEPRNAQLAEPVRRIAQLTEQVDVVMIAEGPPLLATIAQQLTSQSQKQLIGTGVWNDPSIAREPALNGAWFPGPAPGTRQVFENRFQQTYGRPPESIASLAYDAVSLAAALARAPFGQRFTQAQITDPNGFAGVDGLFRFRQDGRVERGLAILQVTPQGLQIIDPPPQRFAATF